MAAHGNPNIVTDGLVLCLDAGDKNSYPGSGTTWYDLSGNNDTTINGSTYNSGGYFVLDGTNDYFEVTSDGSSDFAKQEFSIEFWCYITLDGSYDVLWSYDYTAHSAPYYAQHWRSVTSELGLIGSWNAGGSYSYDTDHGYVVYTANAWKHYVWTLSDGGSTKISNMYQDGALLATETDDSTDITYYSQEVWIGKANFESWYKGNIASVKFYERALSATEVKQNFNAHRHRFGV